MVAVKPTGPAAAHVSLTKQTTGQIHFSSHNIAFSDVRVWQASPAVAGVGDNKKTDAIGNTEEQNGGGPTYLPLLLWILGPFPNSLWGFFASWKRKPGFWVFLGPNGSVPAPMFSIR